MPVTFLDLPLELQLIIKDLISPTDLRTHVCFFLSDPQCGSLYSSLPDSERFWSALCWNNGLSQLSDEFETQATWCDIAVSAINADGFCTHPQCGETLLEYNRARMQETAQHLQPFVSMIFDDNYVGEVHAQIHRVVGHIDFRPSNEVNPWDKLSVFHDAHLRPPDQAKQVKSPANERAYLSMHPLVARSFATFTPTVSFAYLGLHGIELEHSKVRSNSRRPLNVLDVLELLQMDLDNDLSVRNVLDYVMVHEDCLVDCCKLPMELLRCLRTTRDILTVCPIQDMELEEYSANGPAFSLEVR